MDSALPIFTASIPPDSRPHGVANWLLAIAAMVFVMLVVGGITRLTESGLSITEWKPVSGAIPPLTGLQWDQAFALYKATPEFREINGPAGMDLAAFKFIYFWEWFHRLIGRVIGLSFAAPLLWFWVKRQIPAGYGLRLVALLLLGASQGALGWYMVQSGLADRTDVSHFRLSAHLLTALFILAGLVWTALDLRQLASGNERPARLTPMAVGAALVLTVQLLLGAWVAGLDAGYVSSSWPLMNGQVVPAGIEWAKGALFALSHDPFLLHFLHRWWAWAAFAALMILAARVKQLDRRAARAIHIALGLQVLLGIATVMSGMALWLAVAHQAVGALLVAASAWGMHVIGRIHPGKQASAPIR